MKRRNALLAGILGALLVLVLASGCSRSASQTTVAPVSEEDTTGTVTPLERGAIRREALQTVSSAMDAWVRNDLEAMREYFSDEQYEYFKTQDDQYKAEGKVRIRSHESTWTDVVEMTSGGEEVSVKYRFTDNSYFESTDGTRLTEPTGDETEMTLGLVRFEGEWVVARVIAGSERLQ
jgi:predicted lipid-binding transport protein (Tim44 family)